MKDSQIVQNFNSKGFVLLKNFINKNQINIIKKELFSVAFDEIGCEVYYETIGNKKKIRRIENFSNKLPEIRKLIGSDAVQKLLSLALNDKPQIFKEKINFKSAKGGSEFRYHIDGHFFWKDKNFSLKKGWKEYANKFVNLVIPLEKTDLSNGCLKIFSLKETKNLGKSWEEITSNLDKNGPFLKKGFKFKTKEIFLEMMPGDILIFDWLCIHGSDDNYSQNDRPILYLTYNPKKAGNFMEKYFNDKNSSKGDKKEKSLIK
tara:strand:+ start:1497 stop:2279 length:783 start_codon:yes stop_codon:yes gene_type:complete